MASQYFAGLFSALTSQACLVLNTPPTFAGVSSVTANADGSVSVNWSAATGVAVPPVRYRVFIAAGSVTGATLFAGATYMVTGTNATTFRAYTDASGTLLVAGSVYTFGVRAVDSYGNADSNLAVATATVLYNLYALVQSVPGAVWDQTLAAHTGPGTYGLQLDTTVSSRATQTSVNAIPINPLLTNDARLNNLDATISSRLPTSSYVAPDNSGISAIKTKTDQLLFDVDTGVIAHVINIPAVNVQAIVDGVWDEQTSLHVAAGSFGLEVQTPNLNPGDVASAVWDAQVLSYQDPGSFGANAANPPLSPTQIATAVWDATLALYQDPGSTGEALADAANSASASSPVNLVLTIDPPTEFQVDVNPNPELNAEIKS